MILVPAIIMIAFGIVAVLLVIFGNGHDRKEAKSKFINLLIVMYVLLMIALVAMQLNISY